MEFQLVNLEDLQEMGAKGGIVMKTERAQPKVWTYRKNSGVDPVTKRQKNPYASRYYIPAGTYLDLEDIVDLEEETSSDYDF